jgi:hypothetical protein
VSDLLAKRPLETSMNQLASSMKETARLLSKLDAGIGGAVDSSVFYLSLSLTFANLTVLS